MLVVALQRNRTIFCYHIEVYRKKDSNRTMLAAGIKIDRRLLMATQMIIRIDPYLKDKISRLAQSEGKNLSELVRELLEKYTKERDMGVYIDNLWASIGKNLSKNNISELDIENAIQQVRSNNNAQ